MVQDTQLEKVIKSAPKSLSLEEKHSLWTLLALTRDAMHNARHKDVYRYKLSARKAAILVIIEALGGKVTPAQISRQIWRTPHSVSEFLSRMEKEGLVRRSKNLHKKNLVGIELTKKGRQSYSHAIKRESINQIMSCLSVEESQQLRALLSKLKEEALTYLKHV